MPSIAQLVERWTVEREMTQNVVIHRSLVQIRFEGEKGKLFCSAVRAFGIC